MIFAILTNGIVYQHLSNLRFLLVLIILKLTFSSKSSKLPYKKVSVFHLYWEGSLSKVIVYSITHIKNQSLVFFYIFLFDDTIQIKSSAFYNHFLFLR